MELDGLFGVVLFDPPCEPSCGLFVVPAGLLLGAAVLPDDVEPDGLFGIALDVPLGLLCELSLGVVGFVAGCEPCDGSLDGVDEPVDELEPFVDGLLVELPCAGLLLLELPFSRFRPRCRRRFAR